MIQILLLSAIILSSLALLKLLLLRLTRALVLIRARIGAVWPGRTTRSLKLYDLLDASLSRFQGLAGALLDTVGDARSAIPICGVITGVHTTVLQIRLNINRPATRALILLVLGEVLLQRIVPITRLDDLVLYVLDAVGEVILGLLLVASYASLSRLIGAISLKLVGRSLVGGVR